MNVEDVRCCLCPVIHGALKETTCRRWAHMTCLLLIPGVRMDDLINKTRIDISEASLGFIHFYLVWFFFAAYKFL